MRIPVVLLLAAALGGCLGTGAPGDCLWDAGVATPQLDKHYMQTDPGQAWQTVVLSPAPNATSHMEFEWSAPKGWQASGRVLSPPGAPVFQVATVTPGPGSGNATLAFTEFTEVGGCQGRSPGRLVWDLALPKAGDAAMPGQGVHVMTAGFFENGTLFYTNIAEIDSDPRWPHAAMYSWEGDMPLPVYVYDAARDEQPAYWQSPSTHVSPVTGKVPDTGVPQVDERIDQLPYGLDEETGAGYFTTIEGFNDALQGLSTTTTRVVRLAPEEAYTLPGYEDHPLYGEPIVFYIKVLDVVDAPCPHTVQGEMCRLEAPTMADRA